MNALDTYDKAYEAIALTEELIERAAPVAKLMAELRDYKSYPDQDDISIQDGEIVAQWTIYYGCGDYEDEYMTIPLEYLYDDNWVKDMNEQLMLEREKKVAEERARKERAEADRLERERQQYLKLKEKFEGGENAD